jgi:hypothetical protein
VNHGAAGDPERFPVDDFRFAISDSRFTPFRATIKNVFAAVSVNSHSLFFLMTERRREVLSRVPRAREGESEGANPMIICQSCRAENWDGAQFCDECGKPLPRTGAYARAQSFKPPSEQDARPADQRTPSGGITGNAPGGISINAPSAAGAQGTPSGGENGSRAVLSFPEPTASGASNLRAASAAATDARRSPVAAHARLTINRGRAAGKEFPVHEDEAYIGRWDADSGIFPDVDLDADDPEAKVSRRHARITRRGEQYFIEDLGSTNGTFINRGRRLLPGDRQPLNDGDEIIIGKTFLRFQVVK